MKYEDIDENLQIKNVSDLEARLVANFGNIGGLMSFGGDENEEWP